MIYNITYYIIYHIFKISLSLSHDKKNNPIHTMFNICCAFCYIEHENEICNATSNSYSEIKKTDIVREDTCQFMHVIY